jgi:UDP-N-acetylglucosamine/UDP-N-acetylgalactosamine diphosphorylase
VTSEQTSELKSELESRLAPFGQSHVLRFWDELDPEAQDNLSEQIYDFDLEQLGQLFEQKESAARWDELAKKASVPPAITLANFADPKSYDAAWQTGAELLAQGKVAMIITAGGQGSRLGFDHPKGMFPIGPVSDVTLFQIFFEKVMARAHQFGSKVPIYIMTSPPTHEETIEFLEAENYFGMNSQDVKIFCQGTMPAVDHDGKLLLSGKGEIFASPDGHGGALLALEKSGALDDMQRRGVEHVFYGQIDNPLVQVCDPALLGYHAKSKSEMTSQVVRKTDPLQKVGNVISVGGVVQIIEYSDLSESYARETRADGKLKLWAGSIAVHIFKTDFFLRMSETPDSLPFHRANKKVAHIDADGKQIKPETNNAIKFEKFIFDLLPSAKHAIICEVDPADGFCAVKNAPPSPAETPAHVKQAISDLHTRWFHEAGVDVAEGVAVEISPLFAPDAKALKEKIAADPALGEPITEDTYFQ